MQEDVLAPERSAYRGLKGKGRTLSRITRFFIRGVALHNFLFWRIVYFSEGGRRRDTFLCSSPRISSRTLLNSPWDSRDEFELGPSLILHLTIITQYGSIHLIVRNSRLGRARALVCNNKLPLSHHTTPNIVGGVTYLRARITPSQ